MNKTVFVGIDAGTNGVTVAFFNAAGELLSTADEGYPCSYPHPGWVEQDMDTVWRAICTACRRARVSAKIPDEAIGALGFSSQRGTFVVLDKTERPLAPAIVWNDSRAKEMEETIASAIGRPRFRQITGMPLSASWAVTKIAWLYRHRPATMEPASWICNGQEYFLRLLGAESFETDPASLTLNGMLDIRGLDWSAEVCRAAGIDMSLLPPIGRPATMVGRLSPGAATATGLPAGLTICRGAGDQQCAAVGAGVIRQGMAEITVGTSAMMVAHLDHPDLLKGPSPYVGGHGVPGKWDLEGGAFSIGSCLEWWKRELAQAEIAEAQRLGQDPWECIMALAGGAPAGAAGVIFHPFFAGQVTPYYDATARGAFLGLGLHHDRAMLIRAILEGCACEMRLMVDAFNRDLEGGISDLRVTGGGTKSALFTQIQADVIGRAIGIPSERECAVLGAAMLGAVGAGHFDSVAEAVSAMVRIERVVEPQAGVRALYDDLYAIFVEAYERSAEAGMNARIYDFQARHF
ncbi:MAG: xylulose kinase [Candidatus Binataceae bacterium]|nr:xylulose kinase [Candidatus Binataceae bacterium]